jgi:phospholipid/cholesterol/gamma-HCH transport system substrate-binding protein
MPKESKLELKVGSFVLAALIAVTVFIFSISDTSSLKKGKTIKVIFGFANGLKKNAPVRMAGVDEGIVKNIDLFFDRQDSKTKAQIELWVSADLQIPSDSIVLVNQLGLLGEKYIEILPGINTKEFYRDGETVVGKDPVPQEIISEKITEIVKKLEVTIGSVNQIIDDKENKASLSQTLKNLSLLTGNLNDVVVHVKEGKGTVGRFLYDEGFYEDLESFTSDLKANPWKLLYRPRKEKVVQ